MRRSRSMVVLAVLGLVLGIPLALYGWEGLCLFLVFLEQQGGRFLGSILVALSIAVLLRQARARPPAPPEAPRASTPVGPAPAVPGPESPPT